MHIFVETFSIASISKIKRKFWKVKFFLEYFSLKGPVKGSEIAILISTLERQGVHTLACLTLDVNSSQNRK